ncbi:unnamed protein product [Tilletia controversa]|nr:unnamed protein product [Tilletia controversa]CAD6980993.1 unnamed protein product [Tilletia controversa]
MELEKLAFIPQIYRCFMSDNVPMSVPLKIHGALCFQRGADIGRRGVIGEYGHAAGVPYSGDVVLRISVGRRLHLGVLVSRLEDGYLSNDRGEVLVFFVVVILQPR